jgi:MFS family permease
VGPGSALREALAQGRSRAGTLAAVLSAYRPLFARAEARRLVAASLLARAPIAAVDLPLILLAREVSGSYAVAGIAVGVRAAAVGVTAPIRGRLVDRLGTRRIVPPLVVGSALATGLMPVAGALDAAWLIVVLAGLEGGLAPALPATMRLEWQRMLRDEPERLEQAYAFETNAQVGLFVIGPLAAGALIAAGGSATALLVFAALLLVSGLAFGALARARPHLTATPARGLGPIRLPAVRDLVVAIALADVALGTVDVAVAAFAQERGRPGVAGVLLAAFAASSIAGGTFYGARRWRRPADRRLVVVLTLGAAASLPLAFADSLLVLGFALVLAGAPSAAQFATSSVALDRAAPAGMGAEAFNWLSTANATGVALGATLAGVLVEASGTSAAFLSGAGALALAAAYFGWRVAATPRAAA